MLGAARPSGVRRGACKALLQALGAGHCTVLGRRQKDKIRGSTLHAAVSARFQRLPALPVSYTHLTLPTICSV
eukprot:7062558-Alexandrium_andersonii.AAC.1